MSTNPYESPETTGHTPTPKKVGLRFTLVELLFVVCVIGVLVALLLPAVRRAPHAAARMACQNNLKQIAIGLQNYEVEYGCLPPAYTVDENGKPLHSWRTLLLPFVENKLLHDKVDLAKPWNDPANRAAFTESPWVYRCPSSRFESGQTNYLAVVAIGGCFQATAGRKLGEITDNPGKTLMVIEVAADQAVPWMSPQDADEKLILNLGNISKSPHPGGAQAACVDGSVLFLHKDLKPEILRALISIDGKDDVLAHVRE